MTTVQLRDIIAGKTPVTIEPAATVQEAVRIMSEAHKGAVLVVSQGRLRGIFTERDLLTRVVARDKDPRRTLIGEVMTQQLLTGRPDEDFQTALRRMGTISCRHLPVVQGEEVLGMVSRRDLMALDIANLEDEMDRKDPATLFI